MTTTSPLATVFGALTDDTVTDDPTSDAGLFDPLAGIEPATPKKKAASKKKAATVSSPAPTPAVGGSDDNDDEPSVAATVTAKTARSSVAKAVAAINGDTVAEATDALRGPQRCGSEDLTPVDPVVRPNGDTYYPRTLPNGVADVVALRQMRDAGLFALLGGCPGSGKTSMIEAAFANQGGGLYTVAGHGDVEWADFVGNHIQTESLTYQWVDGPLLEAMRNGGVLLVDDVTIIPAAVLSLLNPLMDGRRTLTVVANGGETVTAAEGFYVVAAYNPNLPGTYLSDALKSRFSVHLTVGTDYELALELGVDSRVVRIARHLERLAETGEVRWVPQMRELLAYRDLAGTMGEALAIDNLCSQVPDAERYKTVGEVITKHFPGAAPLTLGAQHPRP